MRISVIYIILFAFFSIPLYSQDVIFLKRHKRIEGKVIEVDNRNIRYKKQNNPEGPVYLLEIKYIDSIAYSGGHTDFFLNEKPVSLKKISEIKKYNNLGENLFSTGVFLFDNTPANVYTNSSLENAPIFAHYVAYEKLFLKDRFGVEFRPFIGYNKKAYGTVLAAKFYPKHIRKTRLGLGIHYQLSVMDLVENYYDSQSGFSILRKYESTVSSVGFVSNLIVHFNKSYLSFRHFR
ncbi:MAG: hypothetical protein IPH58_12210 [Sphingobacteriales bacterium]|nr:hypothetical protein [Sphingobacteriales bacterium]